MKLAKTVGGHKVIGYLVAFRISESNIDISEYTRNLDGLVDSKRFNTVDIDTLRVERRRACDAHQATIKELESVFDRGQSSTRYLFRADKGATVWGQRHLVRETFVTNGSGKAVPVHKALGRIWLEEKDQRPAFVPEEGLSVEDLTEANGVIHAFESAFDFAIGSFPSRMLRSRVAKLVDDQTPINYDAEHRFSFVLAEHADTLELISEVFKFVNGERHTLARSERSDISVLPIPDLDEYRSAIGEAFVQDIAEVLQSVRGTVNGYVNAEGSVKRPADLVRALGEVNNAFKTIKKFENDFAKVESSVKEALDEVRDVAQGLLGTSGGGVHKARTRDLEEAIEALPPLQRGFASSVAAFPGVTGTARADETAITWTRGGATVVQTSLTDLGLSLTFTSAGELPECLLALAPKRSLGGWSVKTLDVPTAIDAASKFLPEVANV
jgi:hypothetical protein